MSQALLESRDLVLIQALDAQGGVTRAASHLGLSQSAVSHHLARLEDKLGRPLFLREGRGLTMTAAGRHLAEGAHTILGQIERLEHDLRRVSRRRLAVCSQCHTSYDWFAPVLGRFEKAHAGVELSVRVDCTRTPFEALEAKKIDLALCHAAAPKTLSARRLGRDPFVAIVPARHPVAAQKRVRPEALRDGVLLVPDLATAEMRDLGQLLFGDRPPRRTMRLPVIEAIVEMVAADYGVAIVPRLASRHAQRRRDVAIVPIHKKGAARVWYAVTRREDAAREELVELSDQIAAWFARRA